MKSYEKKKRQSRSLSSDVPQLGAQKKQSIEPLVVGQMTTTRLCYIFERIKPHGGSDCRGEDISKAEVVVKWNYELGKSLVPLM